MKYAALSFILLPAVTVLAPLHAQDAAPPAPQQQSALAPLRQDPLLHTGTLPNGLRYIIRRTEEPKDRGSLRMFINVGSLDEPRELAGVTHLLEHLVFNGSRHYKRGELIPAMQRLGLGFGGDANAFTSLRHTSFQLALPSMNPQTVGSAMTILRDFADGATLTPEALEHERGIIISEMKQRDSATYRATLAHLGQMTEGTCLAQSMPIGTEEVIRNISIESVQEYYRTHYVPRNITVVLTGDMDPAQGRQWIEEHFGDMEDRPAPQAPSIGTVNNYGPSELIIPNPEMANTSLVLTCTAPYPTQPDNAEERVQGLIRDMALTILNGRLGKIAKQPMSCFALGEAAYKPMFNTVYGFSVSLSTMPTRWPEAMRTAEQELRKAVQFGFLPSEITTTLNTFEKMHRTAEETWPGISADNMAERIMRSLDRQVVFNDPHEARSLFEEARRRVQANPDAVRQALAAIYDPQRLKITVMGKLPEVLTGEELRGVFTQSAQTEVKPNAEEAVRPFAYTEPEGPVATITQRSYLQSYDVTCLVLSNGVRVNLKPVSRARGNICVNAAVDGGNLRLMSKPGLAMVTQSVMQNGGLQAHSREELGTILAGHDVGMDFKPDTRHFNFTAFTGKQDLELQCRLLTAAILHPGYAKDGAMLVGRKMPAIINKMRTTPEACFSDARKSFLFGNDPRFVMPGMHDVAKLRVADVQQAMEPYLKDGAVEVSLVGDFELKTAIDIVLRTFGTMPQRKPAFTPTTPEERTVQFGPWGRSAVVNYHSALDRTIVAHIFHAGNGTDRHRNRRLQVLTAIAQSRLFNTIRATLGEGYAPMAEYEPRSEFTDAATLVLYSPGVVANTDVVSRAFNTVVDELGTGNITQEELELALKPYIAQANKASQDAGYWASSLRYLQNEPGSLDAAFDWVPDAHTITLAEVQQLARELFSPETRRVNRLLVAPAGAGQP